MVTREFLWDQMLRLENNYGPDKFRASQDLFELWDEMFKDCDEKGFKLAIDNTIKYNEFAPNVAGVMKHYKELDDERNELSAEMKAKYNNMCSMWEEKPNEDTFAAIKDYIFRFPKPQRKTQMVELAHHAISFYNNCRLVGRQDIPTIKEYVEGKR